MVGLGQVGAHAALVVSQFEVEKVDGEIVVACKGEAGVCYGAEGEKGWDEAVETDLAQVEYVKGCLLLASTTRRLA